MKRLCIALTLATLAACEGEPTTTPTASPALSRPASTGKLEIVEPQQGAVVAASKVPVKLKLTGATLAPKATTNITPDTGHIHVILDEKTIFIAAGLDLSFDLVEVKNSPESLQPGPLSKGRHKLDVEFSAADHGPFNPRVVQTVLITVA